MYVGRCGDEQDGDGAVEGFGSGTVGRSGIDSTTKRLSTYTYIHTHACTHVSIFHRDETSSPSFVVCMYGRDYIIYLFNYFAFLRRK